MTSPVTSPFRHMLSTYDGPTSRYRAGDEERDFYPALSWEAHMADVHAWAAGRDVAPVHLYDQTLRK